MKTIERIGIVLGGFALGMAIKQTQIKDLKWKNECLRDEVLRLNEEIRSCENAIIDFSEKFNEFLRGN